jgi:hypothetical protein
MKLSRRVLKRAGVILGVAAIGPLLGATAYAVVFGFGGTSQTAMRAVTSTTPSSTQGAAWVDVPNAVVAVPAYAGSTIRARFSGESTCRNIQPAAANHCSTRIVLLHPGGAVQELYPQSGFDYRWDNTVDGYFSEAHAMERLVRVPTQGYWTLRVQYSTLSPNTRLTLDDWTLTAEAIAP